jgi:DNA repair exonuclease SbcCD ATPase subunit
MILKRLELYNCLGILNGIGQDKIEVDFSSFKKGLILIQGKSGTGKSTLLNNCQPFRGKFKDNFLPDGYRYLEFEFKGNNYLSQVYVNKAMLFKNGELLNQTQKLNEYDEVLEEELGSEDAFTKLLYAGRRFKNILDLTKGEKKDLIVDYLLEDLKKYDEYQAKIKKEYDSKLTLIREYEIRLEGAESLEQECSSLEADIELSKISLEACNAELLSLENEQKAYIEKKKENDELKEKINLKVQEQTSHKLTLDSLNRELERIKDKMQSGASRYTQLQSLIKEAGIDNFEEIDEESLRLKKEEYKKLVRDSEEAKRGLEGECKAKLQTFISKQGDFFKLKETTLPCDSSLQIKCPLTKNRDISKLLADTEKEVEDLQILHETAVKDFNLYKVVDYSKEIRDIDDKLEQAKRQREVQNLKYELETLIITAGELKTQKAEIEAKLIEPRARLDSLIDVIGRLKEKLSDSLVDRSTDISDCKIEIAKIETKISESQKRIETNKEKIAELSDLETRLHDLKKEAEEYPLLIEFFSNTGAKVFDLQNAGNQISDVANNLLSNYKNKNIKIQFETLKTNAKGELKEVFDIQNQMDGGDWKTYASDGETVVISNSIREAMCYLRQTHDFKTVFVDELDGSIDSESRVGFMKLLEDGAELNQRYHTFLISHSEEVKSYVEQKIIFENGEIIIS